MCDNTYVNKRHRITEIYTLTNRLYIIDIMIYKMKEIYTLING